MPAVQGNGRLKPLLFIPHAVLVRRAESQPSAKPSTCNSSQEQLKQIAVGRCGNLPSKS